jgi:DNA-binding GntR family transcriptional regulator
MSIVIRTLSEQVFTIIREQIITGRLAEDKPIRQDALAAQLGVSKIPLREALARLEQEGLLTSQANRGWLVRRMSVAEAEEIFELRLGLEPAATGYAARMATEEDRTAAIAAFEALDSAAHDNLPDVATLNRAFHIALVRPGGRKLTVQLIERLAVLGERYVVAHLQPAGREDRAHIEHRDVLDAWLARDEEASTSLVARHIQGTLDDLRVQFATSSASSAA